MGNLVQCQPRHLVLAFAVLVAACVPAQGADLLDAVKARGTLRVGMEDSYPPFNFPDPKTGQMTGYDVDVARLLGARLGLKVELVTSEWSTIFAGLNSGKYDVIVSQVAITPKRQQALDFSAPYTYSSAQLILRKNDEASYASLADLKGKKVGVAKGSVYEQQARAVPGITVLGYPAAPENLQDLTFGHIDAVLNDSLMVAYLIRNAALPLKAGPVVGTGARSAVAFRKGNPALKAAIDQALNSTRRDGSLTALSRKWFGRDASRPAP
jgi:cystine transport system substrate-binding protein